MAENERENIHKRQAEGIAAAKAKGMKFGRPEKKLPKRFAEIVKKWERKEITAYEASTEFGISTSTFYRKVKQIQK